MAEWLRLQTLPESNLGSASLNLTFVVRKQGK